MVFRVKQRGKILEIAQATLDEKGLSALQARPIAVEANCAIGTLYNIFGSLDGLILATNATSLRLLLQSVSQALVEVRDQPLEVKLQRLASAYLDFAIAHPNRWRAIFEHQVQSPDQITRDYREQHTALLDLAIDVVGPFIDDESRRAATAYAIFGSIHGIIALALDRKTGDFDHAQTRWQVQRVISLLTQGLNAEKTGTAASEPTGNV
ncbi:MAG: WHG domain-containing protein [Pseudomonadota bacterium]